MATVELRFTASAEHVRTARLVAVAFVRRVGMDAARLDEVRLAVGESCARAVRRCQAAGLPGAVWVGLDLFDGQVRAVVRDPATAPAVADDDVALALVRALADTTALEDGPGGEGGQVTMTWDLRQ
jgi:anti-sigma regulatory factor (Ser/Thr protein kinase)